MVARWPVAASCLLHETEEVVPLEHRLALLGKAVSHVSCDADRAALTAEFAALASEVQRVLAASAASGPAKQERPKPSSPPVMPTIPAPILTRSQAAAYDRLLRLGELYFSGAGEGPLAIRAEALLIAPSGCGKTFIVRSLAQRLGARYIRVTRGDWGLQYARWGEPTLFTVLKALATSERVILHIDELEKFTNIVGTAAGDWGSSMAGEIFSALDRIYPVQQWRAAEAGHGGPGTIDTTGIEDKIQRRLLMIGSGTWQDLFEAQNANTMGFVPTPPTPVTFASILAARVIPPELFLRFSSDVIICHYPAADEVNELLDRFGLSALAREVGEPIDASRVDLRGGGGMRALETLRLRLLLRRQARMEQGGLP